MIVLTAMAALILAGWWFYQVQSSRIRADKFEDLRAVAQLKSDQIVRWRRERIGDAGVFATGVTRTNILQWLDGQKDPGLRDAIRRRLADWHSAMGYENLIVSDLGGKVLFSLAADPPVLEPAEKALVDRVAATGAVDFGDFFTDSGTSRVLIAVAAPLPDDAGNVRAVALLRSDAAEFLYPLLGTWPAATNSAEMLLVGRDGDDALALSPLRHLPQPPLTVRIPLSRTEVAGVQAVLGVRGEYEGLDYRGIPVLADLRAIPDTPWFMVAKMDRDEVLADAHRLGRAVLLFVSLGILLTGAMAFSIHNHRSRNLYRALLEAERESHEGEVAFRTVFEKSFAIKLLLDPGTGLIVAASEGAARFYGYPLSTLVGLDVREIDARPREEVEAAIRRRLDGAMDGQHLRHRLANGEFREVEVFAGKVEVKGRVLLHCIVNDVTDRKRAEEAIQRSEQFVRNTLDSLEARVCVVDESGTIIAVNKAWTDNAREGSPNPDRVLLGANYFDACDIRTGEEVALARAASDGIRAVLRGELPRFEMEYPCPYGGMRHWFVLRALPLVESDSPRVIVSHENVTALKLAEEAARTNEAFLRAVFDHAPFEFWVRDVEGRMLIENRAIIQHWGAQLGKRPEEIGLVPEELERWLANNRRAISGELVDEEVVSVCGGEVATYRSIITPIRDQGRVTGILGIGIDTTQFKRAQERLQAAEQSLRQIVEHAPFPIMVHADDGGVLLLNRAWVELSGYRREEIATIEAWTLRAHGEDAPKIREIISGLFRLEQYFQDGEFPVRCADGQTRYWNFATAPLGRAEDGRRQVISMASDVTERRRAEEALRESERLVRAKGEELERYFSSSLDLFCIADNHGVFLRLNPQWESLLGYPLPELLGRSYMDFVHPDDREKTLAAMATLAGQKEVIGFENRYVCRDGSFRWIEWRAIPHGDFVHGAARDVTRRKNAEERLARAVERMNLATHSAGIGVWEYELASSRLDWDDLMLELYGKTPESFDNHLGSWVAALHPDDRETELARTEAAIAAGIPYNAEFRIVRTDGEVRTIKADAIMVRDPDGKIVRMVGLNRDITEQRAVEAALRKEQHFTSVLLDHIVDGVVACDAAGNLVLFNKTSREWHGTDVLSIPKEQWSAHFGLYREDERTPLPIAEIPLSRAFKGETIRDVGMVIIAAGMPPRHVLTNGGPLHDDDGQKIGAVVAMHDVTERKQAEAELRLALAALNSAANAIAITDIEGRIQWINPAWSRLTGHTREEALGKTHGMISSGIQDAGFYDDMWATIRAGRVWRGELVNRRRDGSLYNEEETITPLVDSRGKVTHFIAIKQDITERKRAQELQETLQAQLLHAQKMESIGRLAGGVAHDFNNMLTVISGHADIILEELDDSSPIHDDVKEIRASADRSANLTRQLLAFARKQTINPRVLDLNQTVAGMLKMLSRLIGESIELEWKPTIPLWPVRIDPSHMDQILANLAVNARDAINGVGKLTVETRNFARNEEWLALHRECTPGEYVLLTVTDTGCGMDEATLEHLFEPFFTTKEQGKGTGLGLATVYGTVKQNNGYIYVRSSPGRGTTFEIYLPRAEDEAPLRDPGTAAPQPARGSETILVVEDEPAILHMTERLLRRAGYRVLTADCPDAAIELAADHEGPIHMLVTDVMMPGMNGSELKRRLTSARPGLKVLYVSGYTANEIAPEEVEKPDFHFLQKPYAVQVLAAKVREILDL